MKRNKENKELIQRVKTISRNGFHNIKTINSDDIDFLAKNIRSTDNELVEKIYWAIGQIGIHRYYKIGSLNRSITVHRLTAARRLLL